MALLACSAQPGDPPPLAQQVSAVSTAGAAYCRTPPLEKRSPAAIDPELAKSKPFPHAVPGKPGGKTPGKRDGAATPPSRMTTADRAKRAAFLVALGKLKATTTDATTFAIDAATLKAKMLGE